MSTLQLSPLLWLVGFQLALYALGWGLLSGLLGPGERPAVTHWALFLLLTALALVLAGSRGEPRLWVFYTGANLASLLAFAAMRRGVELFMRVPPADSEQLAFLAGAGAVFLALGPGEAQAPWRVLLAHTAQGVIVLRTVQRAWGPVRAEFGRRTQHAVAGSGLVLGALLLLMALRQLWHWPVADELQRVSLANHALTYYYVLGAALFNFGFMVLLTQRLLGVLRRASRLDELTQIPNRRAVVEALERAWQRFQRHGRPFAAVLVDIDRFKGINDTLGHAAGDAVLVQLAARLQHHARGGDTVGRIGGEEFLLILDDVHPAQAVPSAERLCRRIGDQPVPALEHVVPVTASLGVAVATLEDASAEAVIARADRALYRAKADGRNRVVVDLPPA